MVDRIAKRSGFKSLKSLLTVCGMFVFSIAMFPTFAMAQAPTPTLSTDLPDIAGYVPLIAAAVGLIIAAVLGVYFAMRIVMLGMVWIRRFAK